LSVAFAARPTHLAGTKLLFRPRPITDFSETGLNSAQIEGLVLKFLIGIGIASGRRIASELGLPFAPFPEFLRHLQAQKFVACTNAVTAGDFDYALTEAGRERARGYLEECSYVGTAPVPLVDYAESVAAQTISTERPKEADLRRAFADLLVSEEMFRTLGPAITSGRGMFLYGAAGNGKTSIAERITRCFGSTIWIPRVLDIDGQVVKLYDPASHQAVAAERAGLFRIGEPDARWVEIRRPTLVAGGELTMDSLEIRFDPLNRVSEAPLQLKSNGGVMLIDDFGRQRMPPIELLNRWIVPMEKRQDFLSLANGKKVAVPFDQLLIFSTNLEPKDLVDEAFLRRIPYKINTVDPTEDQFRLLFAMFASGLGFDSVDDDALDHLIDRHFRALGRPFRCCHPRDLLLQVRNYCLYNDQPIAMTPGHFDFAAATYFTIA
jgi:predicted ATPase with chaperone activity